MSVNDQTKTLAPEEHLKTGLTNPGEELAQQIAADRATEAAAKSLDYQNKQNMMTCLNPDKEYQVVANTSYGRTEVELEPSNRTNGVIGIVDTDKRDEAAEIVQMLEDSGFEDPMLTDLGSNSYTFRMEGPSYT